MQVLKQSSAPALKQEATVLYALPKEDLDAFIKLNLGSLKFISLYDKSDDVMSELHGPFSKVTVSNNSNAYFQTAGESWVKVNLRAITAFLEVGVKSGYLDSIMANVMVRLKSASGSGVILVFIGSVKSLPSMTRR